MAMYTSDDRVRSPVPVERYDPQFFNAWITEARSISSKAHPREGQRSLDREEIVSTEARVNRGLRTLFQYLARQINSELGYASFL